MRSTKKRLRALNTRLSFDNILFEEFKHMKEDLEKEWSRLARAKQIAEVRQRKGNFTVCMQIDEVEMSPNGMIVYVK